MRPVTKVSFLAGGEVRVRYYVFHPVSDFFFAQPR